MSETRTFAKVTVLKFLKSGLQTLTVICFTIGGSTNESKTFQHEKKFLLSKEILVNLVFLGQISDCKISHKQTNTNISNGPLCLLLVDKNELNLITMRQRLSLIKYLQFGKAHFELNYLTEKAWLIPLIFVQFKLSGEF